MIKYNGLVNTYTFDKEKLQELLELVNNYKYYDENYCTQEAINNFLSLLNNFLKEVKVDSKETVIERKETEEEARDTFGESFINQFDEIFSKLGIEETFMAIHGTNPEIAEMIMQDGLKYKNSGILGTAVLQDMDFNNRDAKYGNYAGLLNWAHKDYKGLVILGIPCECFYKEPLWEQIGVSETGIEFTSRIKPEFVVGYIDVLEKKIVLNPTYRRNHDYKGLIYDNDIYQKRDIDNKKIISDYMDFKKESVIVEESKKEESYYRENKTPFENTSIAMEELSRIIRSLGLMAENKPLTLSENSYKDILSEIYSYIDILNKSISKLKTNEEATRDLLKIEEEQKRISELSLAEELPQFDFDDDESWSRW